MKTPQQIFEDWEATYGNHKDMIQGALYDAGLMIEFAEFYHKEMLEIKTKHDWVSIEESLPKPQQRVYVVCEKPKYGGGIVRFQTIADYIPYMTVKEEDYMLDEYQGEGDYNEDEDIYYTPEGFYEYQSEAEINFKISAKITHWMPLKALP